VGEMRTIQNAEQQSQLFAAIVESTDDAVLSLTLDGTITSWNRGAEQLYGYTADEIVGNTISTLVPEDRTSELDDLLESARQGERIEHVETVRIRKDRDAVEVSLTISPIFDGRGTVVGASTIARDITTAKEAERRLKQAARHFDISQDLLCTATLDGYFRDLNQRWEETFGWTREELCSRPFIDFVHPEDREATIAETAHLGEGLATVDFSNRYRAKDGDWRWLSWTAAADPDEGFIYASARDTTERRELERAKDEFVSIVSHELRTPLTSIRGSLGLLESGVLGPLPDEGQGMVEIAVQNTDRLVRLINNILDIERIQSGAIDMQTVTCDVAELIAHAVESLRQLAVEAQVTLSADPASVSIVADPDRLLQTLTNLISNAIKFSPAGGTVRVSCGRREGEILVSVSDEGRGIPADKLDSIFERFQQVDASDSRAKGGTGLGLAISRTIVENHGGRIWVESVPEKGSTFSFAIPAPAEHARANGD
jgi:two-component system sensor histidine kinase VicK